MKPAHLGFAALAVLAATAGYAVHQFTSKARAEEAQLTWERSVLLAVEESENAMTRFVREQSRRESLARAAVQADRAVELAQTQYREGLSDFQAVLDSQRIVAALEDDLAVSDAAVSANLIALHKALGG